ncbi:ATP-binding protein [Flavimaricola marinus]|uniref:histidine kinase n=1 Tax=Flavimaricola marinus TaxID=1819565 RepID=A0A238LDE4_9RHOB|nr:ATP-binding protein [Flavimaricola marinus]SMY07648.1 Osmolarity sensor protein EnvZ [Flavimaricola marinus]
MNFEWIKKYLPRSLYARAFLILILPVLGLQLVISVSFIQRHFEGVTKQMTASIALELTFLADQASAAPDVDEARAAARAIADPLQFVVELPASSVPADDLRRFYDLSGKTVIETLREQVPNLGAVHLIDDRKVSLWITVPQGIMQVDFDRVRLSASNPHQLLVLMVVLGVFMTLIAFIFLRNQLRPIKRMAAAAAEYGKGRTVPYHPSGATEVRAAGMAFLDMRARIERQTQARTMMLSGVSHDLRTPLTRLRLGLSILADDEAEDLIRDVDEMQRLLDGFLDFARGDAGDDLELTDPIALITQIVEDAQRAGQAAHLGVMPSADLGQVPLRPIAIRRAMENLIGNALRYGSEAVVSLTAGERSLRFSVEDDGPGIPAQDRDEAMKPFTRLDPARNQDLGSGVGLGLAIVADIARTHGGVLRLGESDALGGLRADLVIAR